MATTYQQTDTDQSDVCAVAAYCSTVGGTIETDRAKTAEVSGTAGTTEVTFSNGILQTDDIEWSFLCIPTAGSTRNSGTWTVNVDFSTGAMTVTWESLFMCRLNSSCVNQETMASATSLGIATNAGNQSSTLEDPDGTFDVGDKVVFILGFSNTHEHSTSNVGITPSLTITSPWDEPAAGGRRRVMVVS